jgi:hypothetical protein
MTCWRSRRRNCSIFYCYTVEENIRLQMIDLLFLIQNNFTEICLFQCERSPENCKTVRVNQPKVSGKQQMGTWDLLEPGQG